MFCWKSVGLALTTGLLRVERRSWLGESQGISIEYVEAVSPNFKDALVCEAHLMNFIWQCTAISGQGFSRGSYQCICVPGYYFPDKSAYNEGRAHYLGTIIEQEYEKHQEVSQSVDTIYPTSKRPYFRFIVIYQKGMLTLIGSKLLPLDAGSFSA